MWTRRGVGVHGESVKSVSRNIEENVLNRSETNEKTGGLYYMEVR